MIHYSLLAHLNTKHDTKLLFPYKQKHFFTLVYSSANLPVQRNRQYSIYQLITYANIIVSINLLKQFPQT